MVAVPPPRDGRAPPHDGRAPPHDGRAPPHDGRKGHHSYIRYSTFAGRRIVYSSDGPCGHHARRKSVTFTRPLLPVDTYTSLPLQYLQQNRSASSARVFRP